MCIRDRFLFGGQAASGAGNLGPIPSTPAIGFTMIFGGAILMATCAALVGVLLWIANSRLRSFETTIASST